MTEKLKPCPFCGGEAEAIISPPKGGYDRISCACGCEVEGDGLAGCVAAWNRRADEWRDIESAPRDGSMFLVLLPRMMNLIVRADYNTIHGYFRTDFRTDGGITSPTFFHKGDMWQPLPALPTPPEGE